MPQTNRHILMNSRPLLRRLTRKLLRNRRTINLARSRLITRLPNTTLPSRITRKKINSRRLRHTRSTTTRPQRRTLMSRANRQRSRRHTSLHLLLPKRSIRRPISTLCNVINIRDTRSRIANLYRHRHRPSHLRITRLTSRRRIQILSRHTTRNNNRQQKILASNTLVSRQTPIPIRMLSKIFSNSSILNLITNSPHSRHHRNHKLTQANQSASRRRPIITLHGTTRKIKRTRLLRTQSLQKRRPRHYNREITLPRSITTSTRHTPPTRQRIRITLPNPTMNRLLQNRRLNRRPIRIQK